MSLRVPQQSFGIFLKKASLLNIDINSSTDFAALNKIAYFPDKFP